MGVDVTSPLRTRSRGSCLRGNARAPTWTRHIRTRRWYGAAIDMAHVAAERSPLPGGEGARARPCATAARPPPRSSCPFLSLRSRPPASRGVSGPGRSVGFARGAEPLVGPQRAVLVQVVALPPRDDRGQARIHNCGPQATQLRRPAQRLQAVGASIWGAYSATKTAVLWLPDASLRLKLEPMSIHSRRGRERICDLRDRDVGIAPVPRPSHKALPPVPDAPLLASA